MLTVVGCPDDPASGVYSPVASLKTKVSPFSGVTSETSLKLAMLDPVVNTSSPVSFASVPWTSSPFLILKLKIK
jgi:hypothetical protein